jgi:sulfonate transport system substrate-binding protein
MTVRLGVHKSNPSLFFLSHLDLLDRELAPLGERGEFHHYTDGIRTGALLTEGVFHFGGTGSTPPIAAQAEGHDVVYAAVSAPRPDHGALLVKAEGPVAGVGDLAGRPVVLAVGSWQTHLVAKALSREGLSYREVEARVTDPATARRQLLDGEIAAWVAQEADLVEALESGLFRVLVPTGEVISNRSVYFTRRDLAPEIVGAVAAALQEADRWVAGNLADAAKIAAAELGRTPELWEKSLARLPWALEPVSAEFAAEQQDAADVLAEGGFLPRTVTVADAVVPALAAAVAGALAGAGR